jgi:hypothetical protein
VLVACRQPYCDGQLDPSHVELDLDELGLSGQGGGMAPGNPMQAFAAIMEAMAGRAGPRGMTGRQGGKVRLTVSNFAAVCCWCGCGVGY